nr:MAG TPA: hypothetical protein [Caudoviricetes sp.]
MSLLIRKTTKLSGEFKIDNEVVKQVIVDIDDKGVSTVQEYMYNTQLYSANRKEMRKQEKEFRDKRYEIEDAILAESESKEQE